jgi:hypothetical protein
MLNLINEGEKDYIRRTRVSTANTTMCTEYGVRQYPLPDDFLGAERVMYNSDPDGDPDWKTLEATTVARLSVLHPNFLDDSTNNYDDPTRYYIHDGNIIFDPIPDYSGTVDNIHLFYEDLPSAHEALSENSNLDPSLESSLLHYLLMKCHTQDQEYDLAKQNGDLYFEMVTQGKIWKDDRQLDDMRSMDSETSRTYNTQGGAGWNPLV